MNLKQKQFLDTYIGLPLIYLHILVARFLGFILKRDHSLNKQPEEICIIKLLGLGSVIMASDAIYSIKLKYPEAKLSVICSKGIESGIRSIHLFEQVYVIDDSSLYKLLLSSARTIFQLQKKKNLWIVDLEAYSKLTGILSSWTLALNRFGFYFSQVSFRYNLYTHNIYFNTIINVEDNYAQMARGLGVTAFQSYTIKGFPPRQANRRYTFIAVNNTCSELAQERKLPDEQLWDICQWIITQTPYKVALLGAPSDKNANDRFVAQYAEDETSVVNVAGKYEFENYYRFLYDECAIMVTIDSAPLHIANKLNIPNISIWGPTAPQSRIDLNSGNKYIYLGVKCSPCTHFVDKLPCNGNNFCIKNITTALVTDAISSLLQLPIKENGDK